MQDNPEYELSEEEQAKLAELEESLAKFEGLKRWSDVIKTILAKADVLKDPAEKIALFAQAGQMYIEKSSNQAEAIKCYQKVLELDEHNLDAIERLKAMYEKRRDWERLIGVMRTEVELMDELDRPIRYVEIAQLATQRLRKPEICIEMWNKVLEFDESNPEAIEALAQLYQRARQWEPLAPILEKQIDNQGDEAKRVQLLNTLGQLYADKLSDDAGAVRTYQRLLELAPTDRRAQEQLKKRYVSMRAWDDLEGFYQTTEKWDELIRLFEREGDNAEAETTERIDLLFRVARLWREKKEKPERAARAYEKVLDLDAENLDAAVALTPIYEGGRDPKKLVNVYEVRLKHIEDLEERLALLREAGVIYEERIKDTQTAFERYLEAFSLDPLRDITREDVSRLAPGVEGGWDLVVAGLEDAISGATDPEATSRLRLHSGRVLTEIGRVDDAITQLSAVYDAEPDNMEAAAALEPLYRQTGRYQDLIEIYERRSDLETEPEVRRKLAYDMASLQENELKSPERAIDAYRGILDEYGDAEIDAYRALERLYEQQEQWDDLVLTLQRRIDLGPESSEELASLKFRSAQAQQLHLGGVQDAVDLYREILGLLPEHEGARAALEGLLDDGEHGVLAAEILEPMYEVAGEWESLVRALEVLAKGSPDPQERLRLLTKVGQVAGTSLSDAARAFDAYLRALREMPGDVDTLGQLEILAMEQERFAELVKELLALGGEETDPSLARSLFMKAAEYSATQLGDMEGSVQAYTRILEDDPADEEVLASLETLFRVRQRWPDLLGVLRKRVELTDDPAAKEQLLAQMAAVHQAELNQPEESISLYREILELDPTSAQALGALEELFEGQQLWGDLADNVSRQLELADDPDRQINLMLRLAELREQRMEAAEAAIDIYREVLDRDPSNAASVQALERLMQSPEYEFNVAQILEPLYRDIGELHKLIAVHEVQIRHADSIDHKVELLHTIAELQEVQLGNLNEALGTYARALGHDPSNAITQQNLERLGNSTGEAERLAQTYEQQIAEVDDPMVAAALRVKAAEIRENLMGDIPSAIEHYKQVLELDNQHEGAADALERLYQMSEQYEALAGIYLAKARMSADLDVQKQQLFRAAQTYEDILENPERAIEVYREVLEQDSEDIPALDKLIELHLKLEKWEPLLEVYTRKSDIVVDPEEKKRLFVEMGAVYERELNDLSKAIDTYQRILEVDPDDLTAIGRLDALYVATENWEELLSVLEREADLTQDPYEAVAFRYRIAELWDQRLGDSTRAVEGFREILDLSPDHAATLAALEGMIAGKREPLAAAEVLDPVYRQLGEWAKLAEVQEVRVANEEDPLRKVELLHGLAELFELQLDNVRGAFDAFGRSLVFDTNNEVSQAALERLGAILGSWDDVTKLYDDAITKLREEDEGSHIELSLRCAQLYEVQVENVEAAIERYQWVVDADPGHAQALEALDRLYEGTSRWNELAAVLRKEIDVAPTPDDMLHLQFRLGQVFQTQLSRVNDAVTQYRDILAAAPEYQPAVQSLELLFAEGQAPLEIGEILEPLYRMQGSWGALIGVHEVQLQHQPDPIERVSMMHRVAEIAEDKADDPRLAFMWMQRALLEEPLNDHTESEVERLATATDGWNVLANTYADVVSNGVGSDVKVSLGRKLAKVYEEQLTDVTRAEESYRFVLGVDRGDAESLEALDRIYTHNQSFEALVEVLRLRIDSAESDYDKVDLSFRLGQTLEQELERYDESIAIYQGILKDLDPEHADSIHALERAYMAKGDYDNLYQAFEQSLNVVHGDSDRADVLAKMAHLAADHLDQPEKASELWNQVLDLRGEDPEALKALGILYSKAENWRDFVDILEREASVAEDDETRVRIFGDLGTVWYEKLERSRNALESWERVLDIDPGATNALFAIANIHRDGQEHHELVDTLHRVADVGAASLEDSVLEGVYMELGKLYDERLEQPSDAVEAYNKAIDLNIRNFAAMDELERIHGEQGDWEARIGVKERRATGLEEPEQKIEVLLDIARSWTEDGEARSSGVPALDKILEIDPMHQSAFEQLEEIHNADESWEPLVDMYVARVEAEPETKQQIKLLLKAANIYEDKLGRPEDAFEALQVGWSLDYQYKKTADELERLAPEDPQRWNVLLEMANGALQEVEETEDKIAICLRAARWYGKYLERPDYAMQYYNQALQLDPSHVGAMNQMADLYRAGGQFEHVVQVLTRILEVATGEDDKMDVYVQLGELCEKHLNQPDKASAYYQQALDLDGAHLGALEALERIYRERGHWDDLIEVLKRKAGYGGDDLAEAEEEEIQVVLQAKLQLAEVYREHFQDTDKAIECFESVLQYEPDNLVALRGLEPLYEEKDRWPDLPAVLEKQFDAVTTEKDRIDILLKLAKLQEEKFIKPEPAAERLEQVLDIDPNHLDALAGLGRLYRQLQRWDDVINTYERHVAATPERSDKIAIYKNLGEVYSTELKEADRAIDAYLNVTNLDEEDVEALDALARLYERAEDHASAIDTLERLAELSKEASEKVELHFRMGRLLEEQLGDRATAVDHYERAIDIDPTHLASLEAMRKVYIDNGDWIAAGRTLEKEIDNHDNPRVLSRLNVELGELYVDKLDEEDRAVACFEAALGHDDTNEEAAMPLVQRYTDQENWEAALPLLQMLNVQSGKREKDEQHRLAFLLGEAASKLGDHALAVKAYGQAYQIDAQHLPTVVGIAEAQFKLQDWEKAGKFYQLLLMQHRDSLTAEEVTHTFHQLGAIKVEQGERRKALNMFDKALEEDPYYRPSLEAVIALHTEDGQWEQVIHYKKQVLEEASEEERLTLLQEVADLWKDKLNNSQKAIEMLSEAADLEGENHIVLHKLLGLYQETKQWQQAADVIQRVADLDGNDSHKAKYAYTIGVIYRDELKDVDGALERFNDALDLDPRQLKPFEGINKLLTQLKDWKKLERSFRKMLHRLSALEDPDVELQFNLWHNLGVIYRDRLQQFPNAAEAFKMAKDLKPDSAQEHQILAELYTKLPDRRQDAVEEYQYLLRQDPLRVEPYRALYRLYFEGRDYDKAWCVARTLQYLKKADADQAKFYDQYKAASGNPNARLTPQAWLADLYHPDEDKVVAMIFRALAAPLLVSRYGTQADKRNFTSQLKTNGLHKLKPVDLGKETASFAQAFNMACQVLTPDVVPWLYLRPELPQAVRSVVMAQPASICGSQLLQGHTVQELQFAAAHHVAYHRREHYIRRLLPSAQELKDALVVAVRSIGEGPAQAEQVWSQLAGHMQQTQVEELKKGVKMFVKGGARTDVKRYIQTVELTAIRAGFLVCNDLEAAVRMVGQLEPAGPDDLPPNDKVKELVMFSVSPEYFRLREAIGITLRLQ